MTEHTDDNRQHFDSATELFDMVMDGAATKANARQLLERIDNSDSLVFDAVRYVEAGTQLREAVNVSDTLEHFFAAEKRVRSGNNKSQSAIFVAFGAACGIAMAMMIGIAISFYGPAPADAGKLVALTSDAEWDGQEYVPGDLILERMRVTLLKGVASFELNDGAVVSIQGPTTIEATDSGQTQLINGYLHAVVPKRAIGYTVQTLDAKIIDLGTEFTVRRNDQIGTRVVVKEGKVEARSIGNSGTGSVHEITVGQAMEFNVGTGIVKDFAAAPDWQNQFDEFEKARGGIAKIDGVVRTTPSLPADLRQGQMPTNNYVMLVRECTGITLSEDLIIKKNEIPVTIPTGTVIDSYLIHFDPMIDSLAPPVGSITFDQPVMALAVETDDLNRTDKLCGSEQSLYFKDSSRGLETEHDHVQVSGDRRVVSFQFIRNQPVQMDQFRILVKHLEGAGSPAFVQ
ncbi:FecR domain-containing protein [Calycomorphotria hydatis]|uniref:FecR protein n=1 Tax=Calycomorphotria hydatis TaxID=2528027 RepID=A0A517TE80_9PLAN|nr:FecR domain-containing protein [Calycomorphotria hydatis]QDT66673.1 FecR protein [Calycomorphotria hydatis]